MHRCMLLHNLFYAYTCIVIIDDVNESQRIYARVCVRAFTRTRMCVCVFVRAFVAI